MSSVQNVERFLVFLEEVNTRMDSPLGIRHLRVLLQLDRTDGLEVGSLCQKVDLPSSTMSRLVSQLGVVMKAGKRRGNELVRWEQDPADRRVSRVYLTDQGKSFLKELHEEIGAL